MGFFVILESFLLFNLEPFWRCFDIKYQKYICDGWYLPTACYSESVRDFAQRSRRCKIAICSDAAEEARILGAEAHVSCRKLCSDQWKQGPLGSLGFISGTKCYPVMWVLFHKTTISVRIPIKQPVFHGKYLSFFSWLMLPSSDDLLDLIFPKRCRTLELQGMGQNKRPKDLFERSIPFCSKAPFCSRGFGVG